FRRPVAGPRNSGNGWNYWKHPGPLSAPRPVHRRFPGWLRAGSRRDPRRVAPSATHASGARICPPLAASHVDEKAKEATHSLPRPAPPPCELTLRREEFAPPHVDERRTRHLLPVLAGGHPNEVQPRLPP